MLFYDKNIDAMIDLSLAEDIGTGDITTISTIPHDRKCHGRYIAKEAGILCGIDLCEYIYHKVDTSVKLTKHFKDGDTVKVGDIIAEVEGNAISLLTGERVGLNFMQRLSGIATRTFQSTQAVKDTKTKIVDTRKTTPGLRVLEKYAVRTGGGKNHRFNLADGVLIKDNHIVAAGSITKAINAARNNAPHTLKIEVEVESMEQLAEALEAGADIVMLDNMTIEQMANAVKFVAGRAITEASGNMGDRNLLDVANTGVDYISIGALTHTVRALDISLKFTLSNA